MSTENFPINLPNLTTREAITDALYRAVAAYDENSFPLLSSALTPDVLFEIPGTATFHGLAELKAGNFDKVGAMDTTHFVTNVRVSYDWEDASTAKVTANVLAQHYPTGMGPQDGENRVLVGTKYVLDLVKVEEEKVWKIKRFVLKVVWREGDWSVMQ